MRVVRGLFLLFAIPYFMTLAFAQSRVDDFSATNITVTEIVLAPLADGGCAARWTGGAFSTDGGSSIATTTEAIDLTATLNQNRCAGLATAGVNKVAKKLRFDVDAGTP